MTENKNKPKILIITGPTASGKTGLAIEIAKEFDGEIISADSRQIYKDLDIGTEKVTREEMENIPHYCIDIASPKRVFTAEQFKKHAENAIKRILKKDKFPIVTGGTGFYIETLVDNLDLQQVKPDTKMRKELSKLSNKELVDKLEKIDHKRAKNIDPYNKKRIVRSIEIAKNLGKVPVLKNKEKKFNTLKIGIKTEDRQLREKIEKRLEKTLKKGLIKETENLRKENISWQRINELGLEYRIVGKYLRGEIDYEQMKTELKNRLWQYAKRQKTWFKKDREIEWFNLEEKKEIKEKVKDFLKYRSS